MWSKPLSSIIKPDHSFEGKHYWTLEFNQGEKGKKIFNAVDHTRQRYDNFEETFGEFTFSEYMPRSSRGTPLIVFGNDLRIEGFVAIRISKPTSNIGAASRLDGLDEAALMNDKGVLVTRKNLGLLPGYCQYSGLGKIAYLGLIQTFFRKEGIGSSALRFLQQSLGVELIELETDAPEFFKKSGFIIPNTKRIHPLHAEFLQEGVGFDLRGINFTEILTLEKNILQVPMVWVAGGVKETNPLKDLSLPPPFPKK